MSVTDAAFEGLNNRYLDLVIAMEKSQARIAELEAEVAEHAMCPLEQVQAQLADAHRALDAALKALDGFMRVRFYVAEGEDLECVKRLDAEARRLTAEAREGK